jgi:glycosyltransferase involved in cell wall biosynthesis
MKQPEAHVFFPYQEAMGGSQMRAVEIARGLKAEFGAHTQLWATSSRIPKQSREEHGVRWFAPWHTFTRGSFIFIGSFWRPKPWLQRIRPQQLTVIVNDMNVENFYRHLPLYRQMNPQLRIAFTSATQRRLFDADALGGVDVSPIDLERFSPDATREATPGRLRVGRHSRDTFDKHQFLYDPELYAQLVQEGIEFDLMGATCLKPLLPPSEHIRLRAAGSMPVPDYLRGIDCFFYRTGTFYDTAARAVREAMACGLPVVCHRFGGHVENIVHGENGFVFDEQREAVEILRRLRDDLELRQRVGRAARATMEALFAAERLRKMYRSYLGSYQGSSLEGGA